MSRDSYWRRFKLVRVVDGDTCLVDIDAGFFLTTRQMVRLLWVNTPELHAKDPAVRGAAQAAKAYTERWFLDHDHSLHEDDWFYGRTQKADSFGRWLMQVECGELHSLQTDLIRSGHAVPYRDPHVPGS